MSIIFDFYNTPTDIVYPTWIISIYGGITACVGVMASMISSIVLKKTNKFLFATRLVCVMTTVMVLLGEYTIPSGQKYIVGANFILIGVSMVPIIPISINFGSELTFPIAPVMTNGILLMVG